MKNCNEGPLNIKARAIKCDNLHQKKSSLQINLNGNISQSTAPSKKQSVSVVQKCKKVGKIVRNNSKLAHERTSNDTSNIQNNIPFNTKVNNDEIMNKIRCSQLIEQSITSFNVLKQSNHSKQSSVIFPKRNTRSVSSFYQLEYEKLLKEYEKKKEKINHEIQALKNTQTITLGQFSAINQVDHIIETPKFGNHLLWGKKVQREKSIKKATVINTIKDQKHTQFLNAIKTQIAFEQKLRKVKHSIPIQQQEKISTILKTKYGIQQQILSLEAEQYDPFYQFQKISFDTLVSELANSHIAAEQNWNKNIKNSFEKESLNSIFASLQTPTEKISISLKGFVRQMGVLLQNQKYLRNRDLYRIYKRIQPFTKDNFTAVLQSGQI